MKNIPRIFIGDNAQSGMIIPADKSAAHYLTHVMRTHDFLAFGGGNEFHATISADSKNITIGNKTAHPDPSNDITLYFAPIKHTDDLINMATQMGVANIVPVITERTVVHHINWERMQKIATEAAEQSNRNSVPKISATIPFAKLDLKNICFADERFAYNNNKIAQIPSNIKSVLVGPEGGFSDSEFAALDAAGATPISLGKTILRAELAAAIAIGKMIK
jgi:16S rRNA (uracil1498-N3)-methyltransferase